MDEYTHGDDAESNIKLIAIFYDANTERNVLVISAQEHSFLEFGYLLDLQWDLIKIVDLFGSTCPFINTPEERIDTIFLQL